MGVPLLAMPARESRAEERVVGLKSTGITREGRLKRRLKGLVANGRESGGEGKDGTPKTYLLTFRL